MSTNEINLIRRLVAKLEEVISSRYFLVVHNVGYFDASKGPCGCVLCDARQYLAWREPPKVEDPASDQLDLEEAIAKAK